MADIRMLEKRVATLEQAVEAERVASTGIRSDDLRYDELVALSHRLLPAQGAERVQKIRRGELHVIFPPNYSRGLEPLSVEELRAYAQALPCHCNKVWFGNRDEVLQDRYVVKGLRVVECEDTAACCRSRTVERQRLLATGAYVEPDAPA